MEQVEQVDREAAEHVLDTLLIATEPKMMSHDEAEDIIRQAFAAHRRTNDQAKDEEIARLKSALLTILGPLAELPDNPNVKDDTSVPLDVYMGELRQAWAALKDKPQ